MVQIKKKVKEIREEILLILAVCQIVGIIIAGYITIRITPLAHSIEVNADNIAEIKDDLEHHANENDVIYINQRLDRIERNQDIILQRLP